MVIDTGTIATEPAVELRALAGKTAGAVAAGTLLRLEGTRLEVRIAGSTADFGPGTLVEVDTPHHVYLGEVRSRADGGIVIEAEHEMQKAMLDAIWQVWR